MTEEELDVAKLVLREIGLYVDTSKKIVLDQDTGTEIKLFGKNLKFDASNRNIGRKDILFNPLNDNKMMRYLFNYYIKKLEDEDEIYVAMYFDIPNKKDGSKALQMKEQISGADRTITTDYFKKDALKYIDAILKINNTNEDIMVYDDNE